MIQKIKLIHPFLLFLSVGMILYARSLFFDFTNFDDNALILENQEYISDLSNIFDAFSKTVFIKGSDVFYRPMETVWLMLNAQLGGKTLFIFHLSSILLHCFAAWLVFVLLNRFCKRDDAPLVLALFFLMHPLLAQAVAWIPGVVDILVAVFCLLSFLFFLDFLRSQERKHYILHIFFFAFALYTKETAIGMIVICLFYLLFIERNKFFSYNNKVFFAGWGVVCIVWFMMRDFALQGQPPQDAAKMFFSIFYNLPGLILYIGKILLPLNLSVMPVLKDATLIFGIIVLLFLSGLVFISKEKKWNWILFGIGWFVIFLLPTFIRTTEYRLHQFYEHRMYLPMVGILLLGMQMDPVRRFSFDNKISKYAVLFLIALFGVFTFMHEKTFSDTKHFLDNAVASSPSSSLAHRNLGIYYQDLDEVTKHVDKSHLEKAAEAYKRSLALNPYEKDLHNNLGVIYDRWGKKDVAMNEYRLETQYNPSSSQAWHNLGVAYEMKNVNDSAEYCFNKAIAIRPVQSSYEQLALLYRKLGRQKDFEKIVAILHGTAPSNGSVAAPLAPSDPIAAGRQLLQEGKLAEAEALFLKTIAADSSNKEAWFNLGLMYYSAKQLPEAEKYWTQAVRLDTAYTDAYNNLAICLARQDKLKEAEKVLLELISFNPDYIDGYFNLANFYAKTGNDKKALIYINELKKRGADKKQFVQRGVRLSPEMEKLFKE